MEGNDDVGPERGEGRRVVVFDGYESVQREQGGFFIPGGVAYPVNCPSVRKPSIHS